MVDAWEGLHANRVPVLCLQVQGREGFPVKYSNVFQCAYQVVKEEGVAAFWRGSMCSFMKVLPRALAWLCVISAPRAERRHRDGPSICQVLSVLKGWCRAHKAQLMSTLLAW